MNQPLALVVDDEPAICELLVMTLERMDIRTLAAETRGAAQRYLEEQPVDLCLTDMRLPDGDGLDLVAWIQQHRPQVPVAVITAHGNVESAVQALKVGAFDFISKPVDINVLRNLVSTAMRLNRSRGERHAQRARQLLGESRVIADVRALIAKVARSQAPVHISGESGTGKELVARLIHETGARAGKPFVPVNCGAIPAELMESEFFGHKRGSFTGAVADKQGLFQAADGGTLFLDEIADLPFNMQVKLLRVIQEKALRPVGVEKEVPVDVRILSATHRDLADLVQEGGFREDLYYRINVIEIHVPPLRERTEDIAILASHILDRLTRDRPGGRVHLSPDALRLLQTYSFPGNIRELENILERALTLAEGDTITDTDIHLRRTGEESNENGAGLDEHLGDIEKEAILKALEQARYNKTAAAKLLGISFRQLRYRIKKLGLE